MLPRALCLFAGMTLAASLSACPSGGPGPQPPTNTSQTGMPPGPGPATGGPLGSLDPNGAKQETWQLERGPAPFLNFEAQHLRISAGCRQPSGQMDCEALRFARRGPSVELTPQEKMRMGAPGATICVHIKNQLANGRDPRGNEDGFCVFGDGSMISTGSLEYHTLK